MSEDSSVATLDLTAWVADLFEEEGLLRMGHNQLRDDLNLGLGWVYYALARVLRPERVLVIGSYRGFVPLVIGRAMHDNGGDGRVVFVDPSFVDDHWRDADAVEQWFAARGVTNIEHQLATTQDFVQSEAGRELGELGMLFIDGLHTEEQARFDFEAFAPRLGPRGVALLHDSHGERRSTVYGHDRPYLTTVHRFVDELRHDPSLQVFELPFGTGLTLVRRSAAVEPLMEGNELRP